MNKIIFIFLILIGIQNIKGQSDLESIAQTLTDYIEGSTNGQPDRLKTAFHKDLNLYYVKKNDSLGIWSGESYIQDTKEGQPTGEDGKIISIDYENDIAIAKVEISHPKSRSTYIDYFMLLKIQKKWTIVHKAYTQRTSNKVYE
ncbi:nuclear transport factor 2 family protein [Croceitalea rosinachiae]|uniref:Nuclear transport factor 2 family protein n=1 Tax=Croceitalea rosinachiae TaxID=3075596 RepID=A0ABU3AAC2_9FLAO|nr:nuclear transport factor 2 family protein [Croceitalea sp. F388]MDT0607135.1 nuclear transport factor 2 family protein [Croceitalea sp. F388]